MDYDKLIAPAAAAMRPSGIRKFFDLAADMPECISLGVGEPDFKTPWAVREAGIESLEHGRTRYTANAGLKELRAEICRYLERRMNLHYDPLSQVLVTVGGSEAIDMCIRTVVQPGDEVVIPEPCFVCYEPITTLSGGVPVHVACRQEDEFRLRPEALKAAITPRTKAILLNNPSNPTGMMYDREELEAIAAVCTQADIYVISDEIYACLAYDGRTFTSFASLSADAKERTILVNGVSKAYAMTGWRIGYACANDVIAKVMANYVSHSTGSPVAISQRAAAVALSGSQAEIETMRQAFEQRRNYIVERMNAIPGVSCIQPEGAFYVMMNLEQLLGKTIHGVEITNDDVFADAFLKYGLVAVVPGSGFGAPNFVRWSYATSMENIKEGLDRLEKFLAE